MEIFETASFHIVKPCNMACKFCYATFQDMSVLSQINLYDVESILIKLADAGLKKITFAGGEPLLYKNLSEAIYFAKELGLATSIITNGSLLSSDFLDMHDGVLDWIGLSVDSISKETNKLIGREERKYNLNYWKLLESLKADYHFKIKINTVVNRFNEGESMQKFIDWVNPERWKIFDTLKVDGQNDSQFEEIRSTNFQGFVDRHQHPSMVVESNELMTGSYLLIDPQGRLFENSAGHHSYSDRLQSNTIEHCLSQLSLNREMFLKRGGLYNW